MPFAGVICADPKYRRNNEQVEVTSDACLSCAATRENPCHYTYELLSSMFGEQQDRGTRISTTLLTTKCLRQEAMCRHEPYFKEPEKLWPAFRGTLYHGQLEKVSLEGSIEEARYHVDLANTKMSYEEFMARWEADELTDPLSGSPDLLDVRMGILYDYKTNKENPRFNYPWGNHVEQNNVNRWLIDNATAVEYRDEFFDLTDGEVRRRFVPQVWNDLVLIYIDDKGPKPLSCTKSVQVPKKDGRGTKPQRVPDIWTDEDAEAWIRPRYAEAKEALTGQELPPIPDYMAGWEHPLCGYCPKKTECINVHFNTQLQGESV